MMREIDGDNSSEIPLKFPAGVEELFGVLTEPRGTPRGQGIIYLDGMYDRNRFSVKLCRRLASAGFPVLRFDYHGVGESSGARGKWNLDRPFADDLVGAVHEMRRRGVDQLVLVGRCFGARTAMAAARTLPGVRGMAFISLPVATEKKGGGPASRWALDQVQEVVSRGIRPRLFLRVFNRTSRRRYLRLLAYSVRHVWERLQPWNGNRREETHDWVSEEVVAWLGGAVARRLPLLFLFGAQENQYRDFRQAQAGTIGALLAQAGDRVQVGTVNGPVHNLTSIQTQEAVLQRLQEWIGSLTPPDASTSARAGTRESHPTR